MEKAEIGLIGLGTMGSNLALNIAEKGHRIAVFNRTVSRVDEFKAKGIDTIACTAVNDVFVLTNWAKDTGATGKIEMLADGSGDFAKAIGLDIDLSGFGLGLRSKRYAMLVDDGVVKVLNVEDSPPVAEKSSAANLCSMIDCEL